MTSGFYLGFDFGCKRIGVAVGQKITATAKPLPTLNATDGVPDWNLMTKLMKEWRPLAFIVGLPTKTDGSPQYTTPLAEAFAEELKTRFSLPVYLVDERFSTVEARSKLFEEGGYRKLQQTQIDSIAACLILEQWMQYPE